MLDKDLKVLCLEWQKLLRLQDWNIDIKFGIPAHDNDVSAGIRLNFQDAFITVLSYGLYEHLPRLMPRDTVEEDILHELLEIMFHSIRDEHDPDMKDYRWEQCFNKLASAFIKIQNIKVEEYKLLSKELQ